MTQAIANLVAIPNCTINHKHQYIHWKCYHPKFSDKKFWELEANAEDSLVNWMFVKNRPHHSTLRCREHKVMEQWQPGEVEIHKIMKSFAFLLAMGFNAPPDKILHASDTYLEPTFKANYNALPHLKAKYRQKLMRQLQQHKIIPAQLNSGVSHFQITIYKTLLQNHCCRLPTNRTHYCARPTSNGTTQSMSTCDWYYSHVVRQFTDECQSVARHWVDKNFSFTQERKISTWQGRH